MRTIRLLVLGLLIAPSLVALGATSALACSCIPHKPDHKAVEDAAAVFTGKLASADVERVGYSAATWTFAVDTVYKGDVRATQEVSSETQGPACGIVFKEGKRYAVFAYADNGEFQTNSCSNTRAIADEKELRLQPLAVFPPELEAAEAPVGESRNDAFWILTAVIATALVAGLAGWWVRSRRPGGPSAPEGPPA